MPDPGEMAAEPRANQAGITQWGRGHCATVPAAGSLWESGLPPRAGGQAPPLVLLLLQSRPLALCVVLVSTTESWTAGSCWVPLGPARPCCPASWDDAT